MSEYKFGRFSGDTEPFSSKTFQRVDMDMLKLSIQGKFDEIKDLPPEDIESIQARQALTYSLEERKVLLTEERLKMLHSMGGIGIELAGRLLDPKRASRAG